MNFLYRVYRVSLSQTILQYSVVHAISYMSGFRSMIFFICCYIMISCSSDCANLIDN